MCRVNQDNVIEGPRLKTQVRNDKKTQKFKNKIKDYHARSQY